MLFLSWYLFESWHSSQKNLSSESQAESMSLGFFPDLVELQDKLFLSLSSTKWRAEHVDRSRITPAFTLNFFDIFGWEKRQSTGELWVFTLPLLWPAPQAVLARPKGHLRDSFIDPRVGRESRLTHNEEQSCVWGCRVFVWLCSSGQASWPPLFS